MPAVTATNQRQLTRLSKKHPAVARMLGAEREIADVQSTRSMRASVYWGSVAKNESHIVKVELTAVPWNTPEAASHGPYVDIDVSVVRDGTLARAIKKRWRNMEGWESMRTQLFSPSELDSLIDALIAVRAEAQKAGTFDLPREARS